MMQIKKRLKMKLLKYINDKSIILIVCTLLVFNARVTISNVTKLYEVIDIQEQFNSEYDLIIFKRKDSIFHTLIECNQLKYFNVSDIFKKDSLYNIDLDYKNSNFSGYPFIIAESLDSLQKGSIFFDFTLKYIYNDKIIVYEIKNMDYFINSLEEGKRCFNIHEFMAKTLLSKSKLNLNFELKEQIKEFEIYSDFILVRKKDNSIFKEIIKRNELFDLKEELELEDNYLNQIKYLNIDYNKLDKSKFKHNLPETYFFFTNYKDYWLFVEVIFPKINWNANVFFRKVQLENKKGFEITEYGAQVGLHTFKCDEFQNLEYIRSDYYETEE